MVIFRKLSFYLAIMGIALTTLLIYQLNKPTPPGEPHVQPAANPYKKTVAASGIVESVNRNVAIGVPLPGLVKEIYVEVGMPIKKGQVLFEMDDRELSAKLAVQKANIAVSSAILQRLEDQLKLLNNVSDPRAVSIDEIKTKQNDVAVAKAQLEAAKAQYDESDRVLQMQYVASPLDGIVLQNNIRIGEYVVSNTSPAMLVGNLEKLQIRADIDEQNASSYILGAKATAFPRNNTQLAIPLTYSYIEPFVVPKKSLTGSSEERVDTRVLQVIYTFEKPKNFPIYVGQQMDVFIDVPEADKK